MVIRHYIPLLYDPADFRALRPGVGGSGCDYLWDCAASDYDCGDAEHLQIYLASSFLAWQESAVSARTILVVE